jgi:hypothetical protein
MPANNLDQVAIEATYLPSVGAYGATSASVRPKKSALTSVDEAVPPVTGCEIVDQSGLPARFEHGDAPLPPASFKRSVNLAAKKVFDVSFAAAALLALAPLLIAVALIIK